MTDADRLAIALHEAGHAVMAAALGLLCTAATATAEGGEVELERLPPQSAVAPEDARALAVWALLGAIAVAQAGGLAVRDRLHRRPAARWRGAGPEAELCALSWSDQAVERECEAALRRFGVWPAYGVFAARRFARQTLARNSAVTARVAAALFRHGDLDGAALAALLAPVSPEAMAELGAVAAGLLDTYPAAAPPADATGATCGQEQKTC